MEIKAILIGIVIGCVIGIGIGYMVSPKTGESDYAEKVFQLETQVNNIRARAQELEYDYSKVKEDYEVLKGEVNTLQLQVDNLKNELNTKDSVIQPLQETIDTLETMTPPLPPTEGEPGSSRYFPSDIGDSLTCVFDYHFDKYTAVIKLEEVLRGYSAWAKIRDANIYNKPPTEGSEYILVKILFNYVSGPSVDSTYDVSGGDFDVISSTGYEYESPMVVEPYPILHATLYPGASYEGWAAFQVYKNDETPVMTFGREPGGAGGVWFKLYSHT